MIREGRVVGGEGDQWFDETVVEDCRVISRVVTKKGKEGSVIINKNEIQYTNSISVQGRTTKIFYENIEVVFSPLSSEE